MAKRLREDEHGNTSSSVEELCQSVKRLQTVGPDQSRFNNTDQNQIPLREPQKVPFTSLDPLEQPLQHRRQSLGDLTKAGQAPLEHQDQPGWIYEETNTMLRDLHFERLLPTNGVSSFEVETIPHERKAKWYHAAFHSVCAVVGAGVLGLPHSFSYLGWGPGLFLLASLCAISIYTSHLLAHLHEDPDGDKRYNTYREIGEAVWGARYGRHIVESVQFTLMIGLCITYSVTAGQSIKGTADKGCDGADCEDGLAPWIILFGVTQLFLSQVPDFHSLWWISLLGAAMSVGYCTIAAAASTAAAIENTAPPPMTRPEESQADRFFGVLNALGGIAFTFGGQAVLPEIQATLARPPKTHTSMMKGIAVAYVVVILAYFSVAIAGYAAYGATVRPDVLLSVSHPVPLVNAANMMVVLHVAAGYQIFAMPLFEIMEEAVREKFSKPQPPRPFVLRLILRSAFVFGTTLVACLIPFFGELMGLIASIGLMPITFILPPLLWVSSRSPQRAEKVLCLGIAVISSVLAVLSFIGSMRNIIVNWQNYNFG
ncbi:hypothetical protein KSW81_000904 [Nannochloris sp. 'desiccata']|nr:hypothetical protein KSW81_000904 [Chlorella desiccata (nom. nud.)]